MSPSAKHSLTLSQLLPSKTFQFKNKTSIKVVITYGFLSINQNLWTWTLDFVLGPSFSIFLVVINVHTWEQSQKIWKHINFHTMMEQDITVINAVIRVHRKAL